MTVFSLDRDGTLSMERWGVDRGTTQPGPIRRSHIQKAREEGHVLGGGSGSDPERQREEWELWGIQGDFFVRKDRIEVIKKRFPDHDNYVHVDDQTWKGEVQRICDEAGFELITPQEFRNRFSTER